MESDKATGACLKKHLTFKCMQVLDGPEEGQSQPTHVQHVLALYSLLDAKCISKPVLCCISFMFTLSSIQLTTDDGTNMPSRCTSTQDRDCV